MAAIDLSPPDGLSPQERCARIEAEPLPVNLSALLDEAAAECPDRPLWCFFEDGETHTYGEVRERVLRAAAALAAWGVTKGTAVAVMLPNISAYPVVWFALARLGAVIVPVNIRYTQRELRHVIDTAQAERLLIEASLLAVLATGDGPPVLPPACVRVVSDPSHGDPSRADHGGSGLASWSAALAEAQPRAEIAAAVDRDDLLSIQFTSGTTGFPKGCRLTHRYWLTTGKVNARRDGRDYRRILASTPFTYMDPHWLLLMAINQRATLYVARRQSASRFVGWLRTHRINFCLFPAPALKEPPAATDRDNDIVRANIYGLRGPAHRAVEERFNLTAREAFGMTEIGSGMFMPIEADDRVGSGSCGIASPFRTLRIVDERGAEVKVGEMGELEVHGPGIFDGYHRNAEATERAFRDGWFRTGDLFRRDADGFHTIVGRAKDVVRRAGENIAAREVEAVVCDLPFVRDAAVIAVPDERRGEEVKLVVMAEPGGDLAESIEAIHRHCAAQLAVFKIPRYYEFVDELPRTTSGKVAKGELREARADLRLGTYDRVEGVWR